MAAPHQKEIDPALRVKVIESILAEKGLIDSKALDAMVDLFENKIGPRNQMKYPPKLAAFATPHWGASTLGGGPADTVPD